MRTSLAIALAAGCTLAATALVGPSQAAGGKEVTRLVRKLLDADARLRFDDPARLRAFVEQRAMGPYSPFPLLSHGKVPVRGSAIGDLEGWTIPFGLRSAAFDTELDAAIRAALPEGVTLDAAGRHALRKVVSDAVTPAISDTLRRNPDIARRIWTSRGNVSELEGIAVDLEKAFAAGGRDALFKVTLEPKGVYVAFNRAVRAGPVEVRLGKIEVVKPAVVAAGVSWCLSALEPCSDAVNDYAAWIIAAARELIPDAEDPAFRPDGGIQIDPSAFAPAPHVD